MNEENLDQPLQSPLDHLQVVNPDPGDGDRASGRMRRARSTSLLSMGTKVVTILSTIVTIPLSLHYLGDERQGVWMAIASSLVLLSFADLGMGNGLVNAIAEANGKDDRDLARRAHSNAFFLLLGIALLLSAAALVVLPFIPFADVLNVKSALARREAAPAMAVTVLLILGNLPFGTLPRVLSGYQEGAKMQAFTLFTSVTAIGLMYAVTRTSGGLPWLIFAFSGGPLIFLSLYWFYEFFVHRPWLRPRLADVDRTLARSLFRTGVLFMALQVCDSILSSADMLIITRLFGPVHLTLYSSALKLVNAAFIFQYIGPALWPAYGEAFARGDERWVRRTFTKARWLNVWATLGLCVAFVAAVRPFMRLWLHKPEMVPGLPLVFAFAAYLLVMSFIGVYASLYNSGPLLKEHVVFFVAAAIVALPLQVVLAHLIGIPGVVYGAAIAYGLIYVLPMTLRTDRLLTRHFKAGRSDPPDES